MEKLVLEQSELPFLEPEEKEYIISIVERVIQDLEKKKSFPKRRKIYTGKKRQSKKRKKKEDPRLQELPFSPVESYGETDNRLGTGETLASEGEGRG
ncbi:MAG: hypothetical protein H7A25_03805 [Leptospiraceae bacterium]|nr:hypothetical protein [Leptospiraceae bacterium]MCP5499000.1 hypothetical protein [Leptospiraceae bacterium]